MFEFEIYTDESQVYLHSASTLEEAGFMKFDILELDADPLLQPVKPLYFIEDLKSTQTKSRVLNNVF